MTLTVTYFPIDFSPTAVVLMKLGVSALSTALNLGGSDFVAKISIVATPIILGMVVLVAVLAAVEHRYVDDYWRVLLTSRPEPFWTNTDWSLFVSTLVWSFGGFVSKQ